MATITKNDIGRRVKLSAINGNWIGTLVGKTVKGYVIECDDPNCYSVADESVEWGRTSTKCRRFSSTGNFEFIGSQTDSRPSFKFKTGDKVNIKEGGEECWTGNGVYPLKPVGVSTRYKENVYTIMGRDCGANLNWYELSGSDNWVSEEGLEVVEESREVFIDTETAPIELKSWCHQGVTGIIDKLYGKPQPSSDLIVYKTKKTKHKLLVLN